MSIVYIYVIERPYGVGNIAFPNFKRAYEHLEKLADGGQIVDLCDDEYDSKIMKFEVVHKKWSSFLNKYCVRTEKYTINRCFVFTRDEGEAITYQLVDEMISENKRHREHEWRYGLQSDVVH